MGGRSPVWQPPRLLVLLLLLAGDGSSGGWTHDAGTALPSRALQACPSIESISRGRDLQCAPCAAPALSAEQSCAFNVSDCELLRPGGECRIRCRPPFEGAETLGNCPGSNTDRGREVSWTPPVCEVPSCPAPGDPPPGYQRAAGGTDSYECTRGFAGVAQTSCGVDAQCSAIMLFNGCEPVQPCAQLPALDACQYDGTSCGYLDPGDTCTISCKLPYIGEATVATCPQENTDVSSPVRYELPRCMLRCPEPEAVPVGYVKPPEAAVTTAEGWSCADDHVGTAVVRCVIGEDCVAALTFEGCVARSNCVAPTIAPADACRLDASNCSVVASGATCRVRCRAPYVGSSVASCPTDNVEFERPVTWSPPDCVLSCLDPALVPAGYVKVAGRWQCDAGYGGQASLTCTVGLAPSCAVESALSGCALMTPCWAPEVEDSCMLDASDCYSLDPGASCTVRCRPPFSGGVTEAQCPTGNSDPWRTIEIDPPQCELACPDPRPIPPGYAKDSSGRWACAEGFVGQARATCRHNRDCVASSAMLAGCAPQPPCPMPSIPPSIGCYNMSFCDDVAAGSTCEVRCAWPFVGPPSVGRCPYGSTSATELAWEAPQCELETPCPDPDEVPDGYERDVGGAWRCSVSFGFVGEAVLSCVTDCRLRPSTLTGCLPLVPCAPLVVDDCQADTSDCIGVMPGDTCEVQCKAPNFRGGSTTSSCPEGNADPRREMNYTAPDCAFSCPPANGREGYAWTASGWTCAPGWTGEVRQECSLNTATCQANRALLVGCDKVLGCQPLAPPEGQACRVNTTACSSLGSGSQCQVQCRAPYVGMATRGTCPALNIQVDTLVDVPVFPDCYCPDPPTAPPGYEKVSGGWQCAEGYIGTVVKRCEGATACYEAPRLEGCALVVPCRPIVVDSCELDVTSCSEIMPGESCEVRCKAPYYGDSVRAACPADNTDPMRPLQWSPPACELEDCPDLVTVPEGYRRAQRGWECDEGFGGTVVMGCEVRTYCVGEPTLSGCTQEKPCSVPELDVCRFDASSCDERMPGEGCAVRCGDGFSGRATAARCDADALVTALPGRLPWALPMEWTLPNCTPDACADLVPVPAGYMKTATGWQCAPGFLGTAVPTCRLDAQCSQLPFELSGCLPPVPCALPPVDDCAMDMTDCLSVDPGATCTARCKIPWAPASAQASCLPGNTDPTRPLDWIDGGPPTCVLQDCLDPLAKETPVGYVRTEAGWRCDPSAGVAGYAGDVVGCCNITDACVPRLVLSGCFPVEACTLPAPDTCMFQTGGCGDVLPGSVCTVHCKLPYVGANATRECPDAIPAACMEAGKHDDDCCATSSLGSCAVNYTFSQGSLCPGFDPFDGVRSTCCQLQSRCGGSVFQTAGVDWWPPARCELFPDGVWAAPGCPGRACPSTRPPRAPLDYVFPPCVCPDPPTTPPGYVKDPVTGVWRCDFENDWRGDAELACREDADTCKQGPYSELRGCRPLVPCAIPDFGGGCMLNDTDCSGVWPGSFCTLSCRWPYKGVGTVASCPEDNVDPGQPLILPPSWSPSLCVLDCPDPSLAPILPAGWRWIKQPGYDQRDSSYPGCGSSLECKPDWFCDPGLVGSVDFKCSFDDQCAPSAVPVGCTQVVPCSAPALSGEELCMYDVSDCNNLAGGGSCQIRCKTPFVGEPVTATCANSSEPREVTWTRPRCECLPACPLPEGYAWSGGLPWPQRQSQLPAQGRGGQWSCKPGYVGEAVWRCSKGSQCLNISEAELSGCVELQTCAAPSGLPFGAAWSVNTSSAAEAPGAARSLAWEGGEDVDDESSPREAGGASTESDGEAFTATTSVADPGGSEAERRRLAEQRRLAMQPRTYGMPLGVAWGLRRLTASSSAAGCCAADAGRLYFTGGGGAWCSGQEPANSWLEVDLGEIVKVNSVATQGSNREDRWVLAYEVSTSTDGSTWSAASELTAGSATFDGNDDRDGVVVSRLSSPTLARYVRFYPQDVNGSTVCLRVEVYEEVRTDDWLHSSPTWFGGSVGAMGSWTSSVADEVASSPKQMLAGAAWRTATGSTRGQWFAIDLQQPLAVTGLRLRGRTSRSAGESAPRCLKLQRGTGLSGAWVDAHPGSLLCSEVGVMQARIDPPVRSRWWRLWVEDAWQDGATWNGTGYSGSTTALVVEAFALRGKADAEWTTLQDKHIDHACEFRELRGSLGAKASAAECLEAAKGVLQADYAVFRGDSGSSCWACAVARRYSPVYETLAGAVSFASKAWNCAAPRGVANAADYACEEGVGVGFGGNCTPRCAPGFRPSEAVLRCESGGVLVPATFTCLASCEGLEEEPFCEATIAEILARDPSRSRCEAFYAIATGPDTFASPGGGADVHCGSEGCCGCPGRCKTCHLPNYGCQTTTTTTQGCTDRDEVIALQANATPGFPVTSCADAAGHCFHPVFGASLRLHCRDACGTCADLLDCERRGVAFDACLQEDLSFGMCGFDVGACSGIGPGKSCEARCRAPLAGTPTNVTCPAGNTDPNTLVKGVLPKCEPVSCPDPAPVPEGYEKTASGWRCAAGYVGNVSLSCAESTDCWVDRVPSGCVKLLECVPPAVYPCMLNFSNCSSVPPGGSCSVACKDPYTGTPTTALCSADNTVPGGLQWELPECIVEGCWDPSPSPWGYAKEEAAWVCAEGFTGAAKPRCDLAPVAATECPEMRTSPETASLRDGVDGATRCCPTPFSLSGCEELPTCTTCPLPSVVPTGYELSANGTWRCAPGFIGEPVTFCASCGSMMQLTGCAVLQDCVDPSADPCMVDVSKCWSLPSGSSCELVVRRPYSGMPSIARCPPNNTDPGKMAEWTPPEIVCLDPAVTPAGYRKSAFGVNWECTEDYVGTAVKKCSADDGTCFIDSMLTGCSKKQPCVAPPEVSHCKFSTTPCPAGSPSCTVTCAPPYFGGATLVGCPAGNVDPETPFVLLRPAPDCALRCPDPVPMTLGYEHGADGVSWQCASGFAGTVSANCTVDDNCNATPANLTGCRPLQQCIAPSVDQCIYNVSGCGALGAGRSCSITCQGPLYIGRVGSAYCPASNTGLSTAPEVTLPICALECPDPPVTPIGYEKVGGIWQCNASHGGIPIVTCQRVSDHPDCGVNTTMSGCLPKVPCAAPTVDTCMLNVTGCSNLEPGATCNVTCKSPYRPSTVIARCPSENTNASRPPTIPSTTCVPICPEPTGTLPEGYVRSADNVSFGCAAGFVGAASTRCEVASNCTPSVVFTGCLRLVPCVVPTVYDECMYNMTGCVGVMGGASCPVQCLHPFYGTERNATCPERNTDPGRVIDWLPPDCDCRPVPFNATGEVVRGYQWNGNYSIWQCGAGYGGWPETICKEPDESCLNDTALTGCVPTVSCGLPQSPACFVNFSGCSGVSPGSTCSVTCDAPYLANSTTASCPLKNINASGGLVWSAPACGCPDPDVAPTGYENSTGSWRCADGYEGTVSITCPPNASCVPQVELHGCLPLQACVSPPERDGLKIHPCLYNFSSCASTVCSTRDALPLCYCNPSCKAPFTGAVGLGRCQAGNIANNTNLSIVRVPDCGLNVCPPPTSVPEGYIMYANGTLVCDTAAGYTGNASTFCWHSADYCSVGVRAINCLKLVPCKLPAYDNCTYDFSDCDEGKLSTSCQVRCRNPYMGEARTLTCPALNTDPEQDMVWDKQECACPDPCPIVPGYKSLGFSRWMCDSGYTGGAILRCQRPNLECIDEPELVGCTKIRPCAPLVPSGCHMNVTGCQNLSAGGWCYVTCQEPYEGNSTIATCPTGNTDPDRMPQWRTPPSCVLRNCPDQRPTPLGYVKNSSGWWCDRGYALRPPLEQVALACHFGSTCELRERPDGCMPLAPCATPVLDQCTYNVSTCAGKLGGDSCEISCRPPYVGAPGNATCPAQNVDPSTSFALNLPTCVCPDPPNPRPGYVKVNGNWECAEGYSGYVSLFCSEGDYCLTAPKLSGCVFTRVPCVAPDVPAEHTCSYNVSDCEGVASGRRCKIECIWPYTGDPGFASCPQSNTDPLQPAIFESEDVWQRCILLYESCVDPLPIPTGYQKGALGWSCAPGYAGDAKTFCGPWSTCEATLTPVGCDHVATPSSQTCALPVVPTKHKCRWDFSDCEDRTMGSMCQVRCKAPFFGEPETAVCPPAGAQELRWTPPWCDLAMCPDPVPVPAGYDKVEHNDTWECAAGFVGEAIAHCQLDDETCEAELVLAGCTEEEVAVARVTPFMLDPEQPRCTKPENNCSGDPLVIPAGYRKDRDDWQCAPGFMGEAVKSCRLDRQCAAEPTLAGCLPLQMCESITNQSCKYDFSDCKDVGSNESCPIRCKPPFTGAMGFASCPSGNTVMGTPLNVTLPECIIESCPEKNVVPEGYVKRIGGWSCAEGWSGKASVRCTLGVGCAIVCEAVGCTSSAPLRRLADVCSPIELPVSHRCSVDISGCANVSAAGTCSLTCKAPFQGQASEATCQNGNAEPLSFELPTCTCTYPDASPLPVGYAKQADSYLTCATDYQGTPYAVCEKNGVCLAEPLMEGCSPAPRCVPPDDDAYGCRYELTNCSRLAPGAYCGVQCKAPYVGAATGALLCPAAATGMDTKATWVGTRPGCELRCGDGALPTGYTKSAAPEWDAFACGDRFVGVAQVACSISAGCVAQAQFSGCLALCAVPETDRCRYNLDTCANVPRGSECTVRCQEPYSTIGQNATWSCPADVALPATFLGQYPRCLLEASHCTGLTASIVGYEQGSDGRWRCAAGYAGEALVRCELALGTCLPRIKLAGCSRIVPCALPQVDPCELDVSDCWRLPSGASCQVRCKAPFIGNATNASCPANNTDPAKVMTWIDPGCQCPAPPPPTGYRRTWDGMAFECADFYAGEAVMRCRRPDECIQEPEFVGCMPLVPCATPVTTCEYDVSRCTELSGGSTCQVGCRYPYVGTTTIGSCPTGNVDPTTPVAYKEPSCSLVCPNPSPVPTGYAKNRQGTWECGDGWFGNASFSCSVLEGSCAIFNNFSGCTATEPCRRTPFMDPCEFDGSECRNLISGATCKIRCRPPYVGEPSNGTCPARNLNASQDLNWTAPVCTSAECPEPPFLLPGYLRVGPTNYSCAPGYTGAAAKICRHVGTNCTLLPFLVGCAEIVPCRMMGTDDNCQYDVSECTKVDPGRSCRLRCKVPFTGQATVGFCGVNNTRTDGLLHRLPTCALGGEFDPLPVPSGYMRTSTGWRCAPGYAGDLVMKCDVQENCNQDVVPTGCAPLVPCAAEAFEDTDTRAEMIAGNVVFGPAQLEDMISEEDVVEYRVYWVDACNRTAGEAIAAVPVSSSRPGCCTSDLYSVPLEAREVPKGAMGLMVVAVTSAINITSAERVGTLVDFEDLEVRPQIAGASQWSISRVLLAFVSTLVATMTAVP